MSGDDPLLAAISALAVARTVEEVTGVVRSAARTLTAADGVTFVLRDGGNCFYADENAIAPLWKGLRFPMETCVSGWVMLNRQQAVIPDIDVDPRIPAEAYKPTFVKSLAMVPVRVRDPIAAIGAYWATPHAAEERELYILQTLADASSLALANVDLYQDLQHALDGERHARQQAEKANRLKDEFLSTLSHELRTPLHVIQGWVWQLRQGAAADEGRTRALDIIDRNVGLQTRLVEDLIDVSRAVAGTLDLSLGQIELGALCAQAAEAYRPLAEARGLSVVVDAQAPVLVWGDAARLRQVVDQLLSNAVKCAPTGGLVRAAVRRVGTRARLEVRDQGAGVDAALLGDIFQPFVQADGTSTRRVGGLGLGLTIVQHLVRLHGGTVEASGRDGGPGFAVTIDLPIPAVRHEDLRVMPPAQRSDDAVRLDGTRVLVVDDEHDAAEAVGAILARHGAEVRIAHSTPEALASMESDPPHVLVADLAMPALDGFEMIRRVRERVDTLRGVPAAALTAYVGADYQRAATAAGFQTFLTKPVPPGELAACVARLATRASN